MGIRIVLHVRDVRQGGHQTAQTKKILAAISVQHPLNLQPDPNLNPNGQTRYVDCHSYGRLKGMLPEGKPNLGFLLPAPRPRCTCESGSPGPST